MQELFCVRFRKFRLRGVVEFSVEGLGLRVQALGVDKLSGKRL